MTLQLALSDIRQGDVAASEAWRLLLPHVFTEDPTIASQVCGALRSWTWKSLDRRRRDTDLREWIDLLNRVEAFFVDRFGALAAKLELLAELIHESIAVAELARPDDLVRRKHVVSILTALANEGGEWIGRGDLMRDLRLKPANMTRLMTLLLDVGWVEQAIVGREATYRASAEGTARTRTATRADVPHTGITVVEADPVDPDVDGVRQVAIAAFTAGRTMTGRFGRNPGSPDRIRRPNPGAISGRILRTAKFDGERDAPGPLTFRTYFQEPAMVGAR